MSGRFEYGARFEILRTGLSDGIPTYQATISWPEAHRATYNIEVPSEGELLMDAQEPTEGEPEAWMHAHLKSMLSTLVKGGRRAGKWPRRVNIWKESPAET